MPPRLLRWIPALLVLLAPWLLLAASEAAPVPPNPFSGAMGADSDAEALPRGEHLKLLGIKPYHSAGHTGRSIKVAILDSGFYGYRAHLGTVLPAKIRSHSFRNDHNLEARDSQHGILCGEVIHTLAPDAEVLFANWEPSHPGSFLEAVRWSVQQGAQVLSCSIIMPTWSDGEGGGPIHSELKRLLGDSRLLFACAGNTADRHWSGEFRDAGQGYHGWGRGIDNVLLPWGEGRVSVEMVAERDAELTLIVRDAGLDRDIYRCRLQRGEQRNAVVRFSPQHGHVYSVRVQADGHSQTRFHVFVLGGNLRQIRTNGSIPFPGDGTEVITVGAVESGGRRAPYSSCGPNSPCLKPDLSALVPFESHCRARPFTGTSAATPQAAGLAAVLWSAHPDWTAGQVRKALSGAANDLGPPGHDWETGYGQVRLPH